MFTKTLSMQKHYETLATEKLPVDLSAATSLSICLVNMHIVRQITFDGDPLSEIKPRKQCPSTYKFQPRCHTYSEHAATMLPYASLTLHTHCVCDGTPTSVPAARRQVTPSCTSDLLVSISSDTCGLRTCSQTKGFACTRFAAQDDMSRQVLPAAMCHVTCSTYMTNGAASVTAMDRRPEVVM